MANHPIERKMKMTDLSQLPWDDADGTTRTVADGGDMHARATSLATAAMNAVSGEIPADGGDYGRAQARYAADLARIRAESARKHLDANNARAQAAAQAKADRVAAHEARLAEAKQAKAQRKLDKAA